MSTRNPTNYVQLISLHCYIFLLCTCSIQGSIDLSILFLYLSVYLLVHQFVHAHLCVLPVCPCLPTPICSFVSLLNINLPFHLDLYVFYGHLSMCLAVHLFAHLSVFVFVSCVGLFAIVGLSVYYFVFLPLIVEYECAH